MDAGDMAIWEPQFEAFLRRNGATGDAAHDDQHIRRVVQNARSLARIEGADVRVVLPAAWLHDCVIIPKDSPQRPIASRLAAAIAAGFLHTIEYPAALIPAIGHAIEAHSFTASIPPRTLEARVVQDADRLDAIGAIGIARCLMLGGAMSKPLYHVEEPLPATRPPDDSAYVIDHFYRKLLGLADTMQTEAGRHEARRRTIVMRSFLDQLDAEIAGRWDNDRPEV